MTASNASPAIFMSPQMRPELHAGIDPELFDAHYWYRQELMHLGRKLDLSTAGGQFQIHDRITARSWLCGACGDLSARQCFRLLSRTSGRQVNLWYTSPVCQGSDTAPHHCQR